jgi:hypothetical protein
MRRYVDDASSNVRESFYVNRPMVVSRRSP